MKIEALKSKIEATREAATRVIGPTFSQIKSAPTLPPGTTSDATIMGPDFNSDFMQLQQKITQGKTFSPQELILYQMKANQFGVRVELVSKVAETAVAAVKHLQNPQ